MFILHLARPRLAIPRPCNNPSIHIHPISVMTSQLSRGAEVGGSLTTLRVVLSRTLWLSRSSTHLAPRRLASPCAIPIAPVIPCPNVNADDLRSWRVWFVWLLLQQPSDNCRPARPLSILFICFFPRWNLPLSSREHSDRTRRLRQIGRAHV